MPAMAEKPNVLLANLRPYVRLCLANERGGSAPRERATWGLADGVSATHIPLGRKGELEMIGRGFALGLMLALPAAGCYQSQGKNMATPLPANMREVAFEVPGMS